MFIREDDLTGASTQELVRLHLAGMHATSPPEHAFALDLTGLKAPGITFWSAWKDDAICGMGALKRLDTDSGEIKSMRTHPAYLRQGVARRMLLHIVDHARANGMRRLSLETGSGPAFEPALHLYRSHGFAPGEAFGDYTPSAFNQFFHLAL